MWKQSVFESNNEDYRKLQTLGGMCGHERHRRIALVVVLVGNECRVVDEFAESFNALFIVIDGGIDQLLQVLETPFSLIRSLAAERVFVTRLDDRCEIGRASCRE